MQKLIYKSTYSDIEENLSDSNIGARKRKNIRNHSWVINGIINDAIATKRNIDITAYDFSQCFDALAVDLVTNDLYTNGVQSDLLNLIYECDAESKISIKTPHGMTTRRDVKKIIAQGECYSSLKCTVCVDQMAQEHVTNLPENLFMY